MKYQSQFNKDLLTIAAFTLITVLSWTVAEIYHAATTSQITQVQQRLIFPLDPKLDQITIQKIRQRAR